MSTSRRPLLWAIVLLAVIAVAFGAWMQTRNKVVNPATIRLENGVMLPTQKAMVAFDLKDDHGKTFTNANLKGHWSLIFFGFTNCPMLCPTTMAELNKAYKILEEDKVKVMPKVLFISIDPERDTIKKIRSYVTGFNKNFEGATGKQAELKRFTKQLGIMYEKATKSGEKNYDIQHNGAIIVVNPKGEWSAVLSYPQKATSIAKDFVTIEHTLSQK